jgi:pimeloyl-ACP methyl ester carboxylesterase
VNAITPDALGVYPRWGKLSESEQDAEMPKPFTIAVPDERLASIRAKVAAFDWGAVPDAGGWESGVGLADLKRLVDYWQTRYDWRAQERRMNAFPQFTADVRGQRLHFVHVRGDGSRLPLLLLHGWPGSFLEFETLIAPLVADGHDVVVPSLPGYAFSGKPASPIGPRQTAELMHDLMVELFGGGRYLIQGGDWGAAIGAWMAFGHPRAVAALHLNMLLIQAEDAIPKAPAELAWATRRAELAKEETGYSQEQGTRPQTLGIAMSDSPVGVAAWILEKFGAWADVPRDEHGRPDLWQAFDEDVLLNTIMLYLVEGSFVTSTWMYRGRVLEGSGKFPKGTRIKVPTAVAAFPDPVFPPPPRSQARKTYDIVQWTEMEAGGHFAALEQPELLLADMRKFFGHKRAMAKTSRPSTAFRVTGIVAATLGVAALCTRLAAKRGDWE